MKKIYLLVATALLLASCVDDKESAVVDDIRKGKVEQLAAQTELAKAQAEAAKVLAEAEKLKAENEASKIAADKEIALKKAQTEQLLAEAEVKVKEAQAKLLEAQAAKTQAEASTAAAEAERLQAEAAKLQAEALKVQAEMEQINAQVAADQQKLEIELKQMAEDYEHKVAENKLLLEKLQIEIDGLKILADAANDLKLAAYYSKYYDAIEMVKETMTEITEANKLLFTAKTQYASSIEQLGQNRENAVETAQDNYDAAVKALADYKEGIKPSGEAAETILKEKNQRKEEILKEKENLEAVKVQNKADYDVLVKAENEASQTDIEAQWAIYDKNNAIINLETYLQDVYGVYGWNDENEPVNYNYWFTMRDENGAYVPSYEQKRTIYTLQLDSLIYENRIKDGITSNADYAKNKLIYGFTFYWNNIIETIATYTYGNNKNLEVTYCYYNFEPKNLSYEDVRYNNFAKVDADLKKYTDIVNNYDAQIAKYQKLLEDTQAKLTKLNTTDVSAAIDAEAKAKTAMEAAEKAHNDAPLDADLLEAYNKAIEAYNNAQSKTNELKGYSGALESATYNYTSSITSLKEAKEYNAQYFTTVPSASFTFKYPDFVNAVAIAKGEATGNPNPSYTEMLENTKKLLLEARAEYATAGTNLEARKAELAELIAAQETTAANLENTMKAVAESRYQVACNQITDLDTELSALSREIAYYETYLQDPEGAVVYAEKVIAGMEKTISEKEAILKAAQDDLKAFESMTEAEKEALLNNTDYNKSSEYIKAQEAYIAVLQSQLEDYQAEADRLKSMIDNYYK